MIVYRSVFSNPSVQSRQRLSNGSLLVKRHRIRNLYLGEQAVTIEFGLPGRTLIELKHRSLLRF
jgi:hypothetical protein